MGVPVPLLPSKNGLVPPKQNLDFLCSMFPKLSVFPLFLGLCSPEKNALVPLFPQTPGSASKLNTPKYSAQQSRLISYIVDTLDRLMIY